MAGRWGRGQKPVGQQMSPCCPSTGCLQQAVGTRHRSTAVGGGGCRVGKGQMQSSSLVMGTCISAMWRVSVCHLAAWG